MADPPSEESSPSIVNGSIKISLPIRRTSDPREKTEICIEPNSTTPTTPLRLSPKSPTIYNAKSQESSKSIENMNSKSSKQKINMVNIGSATGNPRNKCALQPGHSLMDWIRLGNSGKDLTGVGGGIRPVSPNELSTHKTQKDAWLAIRGRVYNITHYLPYHPGGPDELMRGAGIDATQLFDKVHPWVNYDSLLAKCLIGPLCIDRPDAEEIFGSSSLSPKSDRLREPSKAQELVRKSMENLANCITPVSISRRAGSSPIRTLPKDDAPPPLRFDWIQTSSKLTLSIYTGVLANPGGCARLTQGTLLVDLMTNGWLRTLKLIPEGELVEPLALRIYTESGKVEVTAQKSESRVWKACGEAVCFAAQRVSSPRVLKCRVVSVGQVSHDTKLIGLDPCAGPVLVPLGHHVRVHRLFTDSEPECLRSYTPVGEGWTLRQGEPTPGLFLAVKKYDQGTLSPYLSSVKVDDTLTVSGPYGNFQLQQIKSVNSVYFIAAGTGITPMLALLKFMLSRSNPKCNRAHLLFYNKTEGDILFHSHFVEISEADSRFTITNVLSNPSASWKGLTGRITKDHLLQVLDRDKTEEHINENIFVFICGPTEFTHTGLDLLNKIGIKDECIHAFEG